MPISDVDQTRISHIISDVFEEKRLPAHRPRKMKTNVWAFLTFIFVAILFLSFGMAAVSQ